MKSVFLPCLLACGIFGFVHYSVSIVGVWVHTGPDNSQAQVVFSKDSTFSVKSNDQVVNSGRWWMKQDTISLTDKSCGPSVIGQYKLKFVNPDSVTFTAVTDTCADRKPEIDGASLHRVKQ
jgi:hypothetical protein